MASGEPRSRSAPQPVRVVLVVEDDTMVRMITREMLVDGGFEVLEAADAEQALSVLEARPDVALVFTDIDMPGALDGLALRALLRDWAPRLPVIVTSGGVTRSDQPGPIEDFIAKPYSAEILIAAVVRSLERRDDQAGTP